VLQRFSDGAKPAVVLASPGFLRERKATNKTVGCTRDKNMRPCILLRGYTTLGNRDCADVSFEPVQMLTGGLSVSWDWPGSRGFTFRTWREYQQQLPRSRRFGKKDSNLHLLIQSQVACQLADSRERPAGVEPAYRTWEARAWPRGPGRYAHSRFEVTEFRFIAGSGIRTPVAWLEARSRAAGPIPRWRQTKERKERELNPQGSSLARVRVGCRRQSACPSYKRLICIRGDFQWNRAPAGGVEPPIVALTGRRLTVWPHRYRRGNRDGRI
jgi:hypothetical protein